MRIRHLIAVPLLAFAVVVQSGGAHGAKAAASAKAGAGARGGTVIIRTKNDAYDFEYAWPASAAAIPALDRWLRGNAAAIRAAGARAAAREQADARRQGYVFNGHSYLERFDVVANTTRLLALASDGYVYTNGAHGMPVVTSILWDKAAGKRVALGALFDVPALVRAASPRFCRLLDAERAKRRGAPVNANDPNELPDFVRCVDMDKQTILPLSKGGRMLDAIRVVIMPYEAGPYSEGIYAIDLPVDRAMSSAVRPAWRDAFAPG